MCVAALQILAVLLGVEPASPARAQGDAQAPKLGIRPAGQASGSFFELTLAPGERRQLAVELFNPGVAPAKARSYASDVYTIVNGGFGARLRAEAVHGTTTWLDFPSQVLDLAPAQGLSRSFTVTVPADAGPGEHITSLVIENEDAIKGLGAVAVNQVVRQAVAVLVTVPGPIAPALNIGSARHSVSAGKSVVGVAVSNTGNVRLHPKGELVLTDETGHEVARTAVSMDSFYAVTDTFVEVPLAELLHPGGYTVRLTLEDADRGVKASAEALAFEVVATTSKAVGPGREPSGPLDVVQRAVPADANWIRFPGIPVAIALIAALAFHLRRRRRKVGDYKHAVHRIREH